MAEPTLDKLTFTLSSDSSYYSVKALDTSISGEVVIPDTYEGKPVKEIGNYAFHHCESLTSITIPDSVTTIKQDAFRSCASLTSIVIPDSVTSIGNGLVYGCTALTLITVDPANTVYKSDGNCIIKKDTNKLVVGCKTSIIPNYVTSIGGSAFSGCTALTSITIPDSVTTIEISAFSNCVSLTSISIPNSVTSIGAYVFQSCSALTTVVIGNGVTSIGSSAFDGCASLTSITVDPNNTVYKSDGNCIIEKTTNKLVVGCKNSIIPDYVTSIGGNAFYRCSSLISITIPDSVTSIGSYAFYYCTALTSINIPNSVTSIGSGAFGGCSSLTNVIINGKPTVSSGAFSDTTVLEKIYVIEGKGYSPEDTIDGIPIEIIAPEPTLEKLTFTLSSDENYYSVKALNKTISGEVVIPDNYNGKPVKEIEDRAFEDCSDLASVIISDTVTSIGTYAFQECSSLTSVTIGNSVTSIGGYAFYRCSSLTSITIPDSVTSPILRETFYECTALTSIIIGNGVTSIGSWVFRNCSALTSVTIGNSVTSITYDAFSNCSSLISITVDANNTVYKSDGNCIIEKATNNLILGCKNSIIPNYVTSIGNYAFYYCTSLTSIVIPNSITSIGNSAFYYCTALTSITIPDSVTSIGNSAFYHCESLKSITIGNSVTSIGEFVFAYCYALTSINIPDSVNSIGRGAFNSCEALISVIIPDSVTSIRYNTFGYCISLTNVIIKGKPTVDLGGFADTRTLEKIYVIEGKGYSTEDTIDSKPIEIISEARALELEREWFSSSSPFIAYIGTTPITAIYLGSVNVSNIL